MAAVAALALVGLAELTGALDSLERASISTRFALRDVPPPTDIVIVKIDDRTFGELNKPWPLSRSLHARVIDRLHAAGAREIVYDVQFTEPRTPREDGDLYDAIGAAGGVTLATSQSDAQGRTNVLGGDANLAAGPRAGGGRQPHDLAGRRDHALSRTRSPISRALPSSPRSAPAGSRSRGRGSRAATR